MTRKQWGGRFTKATNPTIERFTSSICVDRRLARVDVIGSIAHAKMLGRCRIISAAESRRLVRGLTQLLRRIDQGRFRMDASAEDIHTQIQQELERLVGAVARKLHTARSRNDQVSVDLRLYCREAVTQITQETRVVQRVLVAMGSRYDDVIIPGYTHLQRAQPLLLSHQLLAYVEMLERDVERMADAATRMNILPLGAGALAGTSLPIDRRYVAKLLGFARVAANSVDAVADRDFAVELIAALANLNVHLSRLAEDFILWASDEFGLLVMDDAVATGSSLMPQKKNPDVLELVRGQAGFVIGQLTALLTVLKGLPLAYNRDLQWDKRPVFATVEATTGALSALSTFLRHTTVDRARAARLVASASMCATDLAEYLVERGVAFRDAHEAVGKLIAAAHRQGRPLGDFRVAELKRFAPQFGAEALRVLDPQRSIARKRSLGSTNPRQVRAALNRWRRRLAGRA